MLPIARHFLPQRIASPSVKQNNSLTDQFARPKVAITFRQFSLGSIGGTLGVHEVVGFNDVAVFARILMGCPVRTLIFDCDGHFAWQAKVHRI